MTFLSLDAIREKFLSFFEARDHLRMQSFPLVPHNDASLLLINSGMAPLKPFFTGQEIPPRSRVATCQKCVRTVDIDDVGRDARHGSFFEMLGNFSFGDYFKAEVIPWAWAFLTEEMGIPADRLYVSIYEQDDEAFDIWTKTVGLAPERIYRLGKEDNFWEHGVGPCGPDSEIHYDKGPAYGCGKPDCAVGCDCDRFMEVWNLVFTQFEKREDGTYEDLAHKNIDTGMGLERLATIMQGVDSIFEIDTSKAIREAIYAVMPEKSPAAQGVPGEADNAVSVNIITDHTRSVAFMAADGVLPGNEGRGYILRRLLRRAVRHGKLLGIDKPFIAEICQRVIEVYGSAYPELAAKSEYIIRVLSVEESRFLETLDTGLTLLQERIGVLRENGGKVLPGADAFKLYDTYGFPPDLMRELLADEGLTFDENGFTGEMESQRSRARAARGVSTYMGAEETEYHRLPPGLPTEFVGYAQLSAEAQVSALIADGQVSDEASAGQAVSVVLNRTPFYAESGGQKADTGLLESPGVLIAIHDCIKAAGGNTVHVGVVQRGTIKTGDTVTASADAVRRADTARNHSTTHLLQAALREVLGTHVEQAGSSVDAERLRFDFTHFSPVTAEERERVEALVNEKIMAGLEITITETTPDEARKRGATALFNEKYGETVRVVDMGGYSIELCGGTHLHNTQAAGLFKITGETGVASGVRRIEALTGTRALSYYKEAEACLRETAAALKTAPDKLTERAAALMAENKHLRQELERAKAQSTAGDADALLGQAKEYNGFKLLTARLDGLDAAALRTLGDRIKDRLGKGMMVLCGVSGESAQFLAYASDEAVQSGVHCGQLVKEAAALCGGGGGGRPNNAQAGGRDASRADEALAAVLVSMQKQLDRIQ